MEMDERRGREEAPVMWVSRGDKAVAKKYRPRED